MAAPVKDAAALVDLGPCRWCSDPQWRHRRGKGGCQEVGCGCDKYLQPKTPASAAAEQATPEIRVEIDATRNTINVPVVTEPVAPVEVPGVLVDGPDGPDLGVCVGGFEPAQPGDVDLPIDTDPETCCPGLPMFGDRQALHSEDCPAYLATLERVDAPVVADPATHAAHAAHAAAIDAQLAEPEPTCAYPNGEDQGEHDHALCEDVVAERTAAVRAEPDPALAEVVEIAEKLAAQRDEARRERDRLQSRLDIIRQERRREQLAHQVITLTAERDEAVVQRDQAYERVDELTAELGRVNGARETLRRGLDGALADVRSLEAGNTAYANENARLREELDRANAGRQKAQDALDEAYRTGTSAAANVLERHVRYRCDACGSRYGQPFTDHGCGPLTPVTVLVVRREVPGA